MSRNFFYITTPVYYVNARPHLGHAYTTVFADILARYHRLNCKRVFFLTGIDEHGAKIEEAAKRAGKKPKKFCDEQNAVFKKIWKLFNISNDGFIRTSSASHKKAVSLVLKTLLDNGFIYKGVYEGLYCEGCEQYKNERDLIGGKCPDHQKEPVLMKEESYMFKLSVFGEKLKKIINNDKLKIRPLEKKKEVLSFLSGGLNDISISRKNVKWGVSLPFDKFSTVYVWLDAFLNYLTGIGWNGDLKNLPNFWPPDVQLMAKDILRVHSSIWPALLLALKIPLPKIIFAHGFFTLNGQKMSKSLGNVIWPEELAGKFGIDGARYLLISSLVYGADGDLSLEKLAEKYNADLANGLGNFTARVLTLGSQIGKIKIYGLDKNIGKKIKEVKKNTDKNIKELKIQEALAEIWRLIAFGDGEINKTEPWKIKDSERKARVLFNLIILLKSVAELLKPFIPQTTEKILKSMKISGKTINIKKGEILFPRI